MNPTGRKIFRFAEFTLDEVRGSLSHEGHEIDLRPKTFEVLKFLVVNAGRLLSKEEILGAVWPKVIVTEDSLVRCVHEARRAMGDGNQKLIRTIPRRGYLFDAPVSSSEAESVHPLNRAEAVLLDGGTTVAPAPAGALRNRRVMWAALAGTILLVAFTGAGSFGWLRSTEPTVPEQLSIAVLPFVNLSGDPRHDSFSDGFSEDLIIGLSSFPDLFVMARNSSFAYRRSQLRTSQIGRELGIRYLLEGSVRHDGTQLRINAQLVDAQIEKQVWAKRYDRPVHDVVAARDAVAQEIVATTASSVRQADSARMTSVPAETLSAYDLALRAREVAFRKSTEQSTTEARELAQRAVTIDPSYAPAYVELGRTYYRAFVLEWAGAEVLDLALRSAHRAISLDQSSASAYELLGRIHLRRGHHDTAIATLEKAISLNPNRAESYASLADALTFAGRAEEAVPLLEKSIRLDPLRPPRVDMYLGRALYFAGHYDQAATLLETCIARAEGFRPCYMYLAPAYAELGRMQDARRTVARLLEISPAFTVSRSVRRHLPFVDAAMRHYTAGLLKAGVPEN